MTPVYTNPYTAQGDEYSTKGFVTHVDGFDIYKSTNGYYVGVCGSQASIIIHSTGRRVTHMLPFTEDVFLFCELHRKLSS